MTNKLSQRTNVHEQPIGDPVPDWQGAQRPERTALSGRFCRLEPLDATRHSTDLFQAFALNIDETAWTYLPYGPFSDEGTYQVWLREQQASDDPLFYTIIDAKTDKAVGVASYLRIDPSNGVIEVGHLAFSPLLQRTPIATEAQFLLMQYVFDVLGYRRYEWKCDALNQPSCNAAKRLGFQFEGIFRQAVIYKNRNRDTAWFAIIDKDWQALKASFEAWLSPDNFDTDGMQKTRLQDLLVPVTSKNYALSVHSS